MSIGISLGFVSIAGCMSGMTMAIVGIDPTFVEITTRAGNEAQRRHARRVAWFVSPAGYHWTLVTLLMANACATEALPIFLDKAMGEVGSIILSAKCVLHVGEDIPRAVLTGPHQLVIASTLVKAALS
jgi:hypothetical protein